MFVNTAIKSLAVLTPIALAGCFDLTLNTCVNTEAPCVSTDQPAQPSTQKLIFVSSAETNGSFGGLVAADAICQTLADTSLAGTPYEGQYIAWLSDSTTDAKDRTTQSTAAYVNFMGTVIAPDFNALITTFANSPVDFDETGSAVVANLAWTGTLGDGTKSPLTCSDWTSALPGDTGHAGAPEFPAYFWTSNANNPCNFSIRLYCVQQ
ncbi:Uncharacterised protein [BD1-7 clade bacterium]|uniref:DUF1554 domain-containing protein n=1 Tax=BD1-7 clade bacterium TaxID=2029982 RepID=A0A5S9PHG5_9GAMM|nr:Uncharacterised protein [BD1-7 clade bacterium]CAA0103406.1 Uncharacterised protein [BD1-7 clade bacterium]